MKGGNHTREQLINKAIEKHGDRYDYALTTQSTLRTKQHIICPVHGGFNQSWDTHITAGSGCPTCAKAANAPRMSILGSSKRKSTEAFINEAKELYGDRYDYSLVKYANTHTNIQVVCPTHGTFNVKPVKHLSEFQGCPYCRMSLSEEIIMRFLIMHDVEFVYQKRFSECVSEKGNMLPFDFFVPAVGVLIEYDGEQHSNSDISKRDDIKTAFVNSTNYKLVRIPHTERRRIPHILKEEVLVNIPTPQKNH